MDGGASLGLAGELAQRLPEPLRDLVKPSTTLEQTLREALEGARARWPGVELEVAAFLEWIAARVPPDADPEAPLRGMRLEALYLVAAVLLRDREAEAHFERHYLPKVDHTLATLRIRDGTADELRQQILTQLLVGDEARGPKLARYGGRGDLEGWLRVVTLREATAHREKTSREQRLDTGDLEALPGPLLDQELAYLEGAYRTEFKAAFQAALAGLESRERNVLRYQVLEGLTAEQIAALYRVHRVTVARWIGQIRAKLLAATRAGLKTRLGMKDSELDSVMRLVRSNLEVSLERVLQESSEG